MEEVSLNQALAILKNRNRTLEINHLIGSRNIANQELKDSSDIHIALKNQIDTYTDCIATIEAEIGRK